MNPGPFLSPVFCVGSPSFFQGYEDEEKNLVTGFVQQEKAVCGAHADLNPMSEHEDCLKSLTTTHDIFSYEAFERAFLLVEAHQEERRKALSNLQAAFLKLREAVFSGAVIPENPSDSSPGELLKQIEISLQDAPSAHDFCDRDLDYVHSAYMTFRKITKGF